MLKLAVPFTAAVEPVKITEAPSASSGSAFCTVNTTPRTLVAKIRSTCASVMALSGNQAGGSDGMDFIRVLLKDAPQHMAEDGVLVLEIGNERAHFEAAFPQLEAIWLSTSSGDDQVLLLTAESLSV